MTTEVVTVEPGTSVRRAAAIMEEGGFGCLPVVENGRLLGLVTSRDLRAAHLNRLVADAMTRNPIVAEPDVFLWEAAELLAAYGIERLPVVQQGKLLGIVTKARLWQFLAQYRDSLTGLYRGEILKEKAIALLEAGREIAVLFLDVDDFGRLNKRYGHVVGDAVLQKMAVVLQDLLHRERDLLGRYGGDEFAVVSVRSLAEARTLADLLCEGLSLVEWPNGLSVSASVGVAGGRRTRLREGDDLRATVSELFNAASLASTRAKRTKSGVVVVERLELITG
jgi:diguanylate cyclase (GGDEF)-like protein